MPSLAQAQAAAGSLVAARETLGEITAALTPGSGPGWVDAVATLAAIELALGRHRGALHRLEAAVAAIADESSPLAVPLLVALAMEVSYQGDFPRATAACERALRTTGGQPALRALARSVLATMLELQGAPTAEAHATQAAAEFDALSDEQLAEQLDLPYYLGLAETLLERFEAAARHLERGISVALTYGNSQFLASTRSFYAYATFYLGRLEDAMRVGVEAVETARLLRVPGVSAWALSTAAWIWSTVDAREATRLGEEALALLGDVDDSMLRDTTHGHVALMYANTGDHERCVQHLTLAGAPEFERFGEPGRRCLWAEALVRCALASDQIDEARAWAQRGETLAAGLRLPIATAATMRGRALVLIAEGDPAAGAQTALAAARLAAESGARIEAAQSTIVAGRALAAAGDRESAIAQLRAARSTLGEIGARRLEQEAARELRLLGASAPSPVARRPGDVGTVALSRREREIADLVAAGNTNPQIARALFLSPKTIEAHMRRIFAKLDVTSRAQVAAVVAREAAAER